MYVKITTMPKPGDADNLPTAAVPVEGYVRYVLEWIESGIKSGAWTNDDKFAHCAVYDRQNGQLLFEGYRFRQESVPSEDPAVAPLVRTVEAENFITIGQLREQLSSNIIPFDINAEMIDDVGEAALGCGADAVATAILLVAADPINGGFRHHDSMKFRKNPAPTQEEVQQFYNCLQGMVADLELNAERKFGFAIRKGLNA